MPLDVITFGKRLIKRDDLHPEYSLLWKAMNRKKEPWPTNRVKRWVLAYCLFSHCGAATMLCPYKDWDHFIDVAEEIGPRGKTRRYFRGKWMMQGLNFLRNEFRTPAEVLSFEGSWELYKIMSRIQEWPQWGVWASFKLADMLERLDFVRYRNMRYDSVQMDKKPIQGAQLFAKEQCLGSVGDAIEALCNALKHYNAPPRYERPINPLEAETVFCKWVSHLNGKYEPGKEVKETYEELTGWGSLAKDLRQYVVIP